MQRKIFNYWVLTIVLIALLLYPSDQVVAKRIALFENDFGFIGDVCQDGAVIAVGNDSSDDNGNTPHAGEGVSTTFRAVLYPDKTKIAEEKTLTRIYHETTVDLGVGSPIHVYTIDKLVWYRLLTPGSQVQIEIDGPYLVTVGSCFLNPQPPPFGTAFTYQGHLSDATGATNGLYDFQFTLYDAEQAGNQFGTIINEENVGVTNGLFTVNLDFSVTAFDGRPRWLEIGVRPNDSPDVYTMLTPRQKLSIVPYALHTAYAPKHNHLGEVWYGDSNPLELRGSFETAPLILSNTETSADGLIIESGSLNLYAGDINVSGEIRTDQLSTDRLFSGDLSIRNPSTDGVYVCASSLFCSDDLGNHGMEIRQSVDNGIYIIDPGRHAVEVYNNNGNSTILAKNNGTGNGIEVEVGNANALNSHNNATYATIYAENTGTGTGVATQVGNSNGIKALSNGSFATVYGENSGAGTGGAFTSFNGTNILVAQEEVTAGSFNTRFRVALNGNVYADGSFIPNGADFAEMLAATSGLEPGDVLVINAHGILDRSSSPNAQNVAGVYSTQPGIIGGLHEGNDQEGPSVTSTTNLVQRSAVEPNDLVSPSENAPVASAVADEPAARQTDKTPAIKSIQPDVLALAYTEQNKVPLAMVGIVPVKVSAENGPIQPGDLLTTASILGHAMKATPVDIGGVQIHRPGTIIGKALEPLTANTGVIRVLVTLQ